MTTAVLTELPSISALQSDVDAERSARTSLREQIARLERSLTEIVAEAHPHPLDIARVGGGPARLMTTGELESLRDRLADAVEDGRRSLTALRADQEEARGLVERMLADPDSYRWVRVSREQAGLPGCGHWHVLPRFGPVGLLTGWWRVKISSGCPLATGIGGVKPLCEGTAVDG